MRLRTVSADFLPYIIIIITIIIIIIAIIIIILLPYITEDVRRDLSDG